MAWFTRITRFGDVHMVYAQEANASCGIACVMMTVFKMNKLTPGKQAFWAEQKVYDIYGQVSGSTYDGTSYSYTNYLAATLNQLNVGTWAQANVGLTGVPQAIVDAVGTDCVGAGPINSLLRGDPIIVLVDWNAGGAHFVVVDTVNNFLGKLYASVCDPWDGNVHITPIEIGKAIHYNGAKVPFSWDAGGSRHDYTGNDPGQIGGWVVYKV